MKPLTVRSGTGDQDRCPTFPATLALVCVDGTGHALARDDGRARRGGGRHGPRGGTWGLGGVGAALRVAGWVHGAALLAVVQAGVGPPRRLGQVGGRAHLQAHKRAGVREAMAAGGARRLSLPSIAPGCSPREVCWSTSKALWRTQAARTLAHRWQALTAACAALTSQEAQGCSTGRVSRSIHVKSAVSHCSGTTLWLPR